jgi:hypothetical protein
MNAVMHKYDMTEGADMPANEDNSLVVQVAELRSDVRHIQSDVTELKADFRALRKETGEQFESVKKDIAEVKGSLASAKIWALGLYFALAGSILYVLARGFRWL